MNILQQEKISSSSPIGIGTPPNPTINTRHRFRVIVTALSLVSFSLGIFIHAIKRQAPSQSHTSGGGDPSGPRPINLRGGFTTA